MNTVLMYEMIKNNSNLNEKGRREAAAGAVAQRRVFAQRL